MGRGVEYTILLGSILNIGVRDLFRTYLLGVVEAIWAVLGCVHSPFFSSVTGLTRELEGFGTYIGLGRDFPSFGRSLK